MHTFSKEQLDFIDREMYRIDELKEKWGEGVVEVYWYLYLLASGTLDQPALFS